MRAMIGFEVDGKIMPIPKGGRVRVKRTGKSTGVRLTFNRAGKVVETKKLTGLKPRSRK